LPSIKVREKSFLLSVSKATELTFFGPRAALGADEANLCSTSKVDFAL